MSVSCVAVINGKLLLTEVNGSSRQGVLLSYMMNDSSCDTAKNYLVATDTMLLGSDNIRHQISEVKEDNLFCLMFFFFPFVGLNCVNFIVSILDNLCC